MSADKTTPNLGTLLEGHERRDAVHIAVAPCVASAGLVPGDHVEIGWAEGSPEKARVCKPGAGQGIVDPYLRSGLNPGDRFYLFLYPNTITSLRHDWTHPAFASVPASPADTYESRAWLEKFASEAGLSYQEIIDAANDYLKSGEYLSEGGRWEGFYTPDEFWAHFEAVTGKRVSEDDRGSFFSCSC